MAQPSMVVRIAANMAELKKNLAEGKDQIEAVRAGFQKLSTSFQGDKLIQHAHNMAAAVESIGGASKLTEGEQARVNATVEKALAKYRALGQEAPSALIRLADETRKAEVPTSLLSSTVGKLTAGFSAALIVDRVISSVSGFAREAFEGAGKVLDLASKTGLSTRSIQEMEYAAAQTGVALDTFTNAAFQLGVRLAGGSDSVTGAVTALGLSYADLRAQSPDEQFKTIADRLFDVQNAQERNKLAVELFGKAAKDILPAIAQNYREIADGAIIAGDQQLQALDMASDALDKAYVGAKNLATLGLGNLVIAAREVWRQFKDTTDTALSPFYYAVERVNDALVAMGLTSQDIPKVHGPAAAAIKETGGAAKALTLSWDEMHIVSDKLTESVGKQTVAHARNTEALGALQGPSADMLLLESRSLAETAKLTIALEKWAFTNSATLAPSIKQVNAALTAQQPLVATANTNWVGFAGTVQQHSAAAGTSAGGFMDKLKGLFGGGGEGGGSQLSNVLNTVGPQFAAAFLGPGSAADKMKAMATQGMGALLGMIPGVGPWLQAFSGPIVEGLSKLASKAKALLSSIFGGPDAAEKAGREKVKEYEAALAGTLTETQRLEAGTDSWKQTVVAVRDAYIAAGRTEAEALADVERLWKSSKGGAEAVAAVIADIKAKMVATGSSADAMADDILDAINRIPRDIDIDVNAHINTDGELPGFAHGSGGVRDFGRGTLAVLHGREEVRTEAQAAADRNGGGGGSVDLASVLAFMEMRLPLMIRDAVRGGV